MRNIIVNDILQTAMTFGLWYVLAAAGACAVCALFLLCRRYFAGAVMVIAVAAGLLWSLPVYKDNVLRARDAAPDVVRLWGLVSGGAFALADNGQAGLPQYAGSVWARIGARAGGADWFSYADHCLRMVTGRYGEKRAYGFEWLAFAPAECADAAAMKARFGIDYQQPLTREYKRLRHYAARVAAGDAAGARDRCPQFISLRGDEQERVRDTRTGLVRPLYDLSSHHCACVALGRHQGCRAVDERDRAAGYVAAFAKYDYFTALTCDQSALCMTLHLAGMDIGLLSNAAGALDSVKAPPIVNEELIAQTREKCIARAEFSDAVRAPLCACMTEKLLADPAIRPALSGAGRDCLIRTGGFDDEACIIGEADWLLGQRAALQCAADGYQ